MHAKITPATSTVPTAKANTATDPKAIAAASIRRDATNAITSIIINALNADFFILNWF